MSFDAELDALTHDHVFLVSGHDENARRTLWVVIITATMMVVEIVAGALFNSMALLTDGFHMATHAGALGVAAAAYAYARKHARSRRYSFGTGAHLGARHRGAGSAAATSAGSGSTP